MCSQKGIRSYVGDLLYTETVPEEAQTLDLPDKDFKLTILNMIKELKDTIKKKKLKEIKRMMSQQIENINKEKV